MNRNLTWIIILIIQLYDVTPRPVQDTENIHSTSQDFPYNPGNESNGNVQNQNDEKVISVRITSSVAVGRRNSKSTQGVTESEPKDFSINTTTTEVIENNENIDTTDLPLNLRGANIEFLKQLYAKKEPKMLIQEHDDFQTSALHHDDDEIVSYETKNDKANANADAIPRASKILSSEEFKDFKSKSISILDEALKIAEERRNDNSTDEKAAESESATDNPYSSTAYRDELSSEDKESYSHLDYNEESKEIDDSIAESSVKSVLEIANKRSEDYENIENVPLARSLVHSPSSKNYIQGLNNKPPSERETNTRLTTISFNIVHDTAKTPSFNDPDKPYVNPIQSFQQQHKFYDSPTIYSQPAQIYSVPAKIYSEPAKIYSEPAKIYSEPAKIYGEPAKIYSEPAKFYSEPASLHLKPSAPSNYSPWQTPSTSTSTTTTLNTTPIATTVPEQTNNQHRQEPEKNYEIDEKTSVLTDGRSHGEQETSTEKCKQESCKVGYVVKGRQFNKYRVEERTSDGFIVGEYGVVRNEDGALRGVRYTADSEASPRLIYDALMKFLQLK